MTNYPYSKYDPMKKGERKKVAIKLVLSLIGILIGGGLIIEHTLTYGGLESNDYTGHEWAGIGIMLLGFTVFMAELPNLFRYKLIDWKSYSIKKWKRRLGLK